MKYYIDTDKDNNIIGTYSREQRKDQKSIDIDDDKIKNILDYSLSESGALEISSKKQKEKDNAEIEKSINQLYKVCTLEEITRGLLFLGYKGTDNCLEKADLEAQLLRQQLLK